MTAAAAFSPATAPTAIFGFVGVVVNVETRSLELDGDLFRRNALKALLVAERACCERGF